MPLVQVMYCARCTSTATVNVQHVDDYLGELDGAWSLRVAGVRADMLQGCSVGDVG